MMNLKILNLAAIAIFLQVATANAASERTMNSLNKQGGLTNDTVRLERCKDGSLAIANDENELIRQGSSNPCDVNAANSRGMVANIGTKEYVNISTSPRIINVSLNSIGNGFMLMYASRDGAVANNPTAEEKEFVQATHKCLLLIKSKIANQMFIRASDKTVSCDAK